MRDRKALIAQLAKLDGLLRGLAVMLDEDLPRSCLQDAIDALEADEPVDLEPLQSLAIVAAEQKGARAVVIDLMERFASTQDARMWSRNPSDWVAATVEGIQAAARQDAREKALEEAAKVTPCVYCDRGVSLYSILPGNPKRYHSGGHPCPREAIRALRAEGRSEP